MASFGWNMEIKNSIVFASSVDPGGCFGGCSTPGYELQKKKKKERKQKHVNS